MGAYWKLKAAGSHSGQHCFPAPCLPFTGRPWGGGRREEGLHQCSQLAGSSRKQFLDLSSREGGATGTAAPASNQFPSDPPANDTPALTPLGQLQRRRSPRTSAHHLLPLSTAKHTRHPRQAGASKLQMGCRDQLCLWACQVPGRWFYTHPHPHTPFLISPPLFGGSQSCCSLTHTLFTAQVLARYELSCPPQRVTFCCCLTVFKQTCLQVFLPFRILALT